MAEKNPTKKKVLMVHNFYQIGGGEHTVFQNEVRLLREHGHEVVEYTRSNDELKESKIKLLLTPFSTLWSFKTYREVKKIIREENIDLVHCHNTFPLISPSVYYAARACLVPVVQTIHNFRFLCPNGLFFCDGHICEKCAEKGSFADAIKNGCYRGSKVQTLTVVAMLRLHRFLGTYQKINYIFLTQFNKEKFRDLIDINGSNVFVKPNFVNEGKEISQKAAEKKTFVFAGRLEESKGISLLLNRWKNLPSDYMLHIYGDGDLRNEVEKASRNLGNIVYYGFKPQEEIFADLQSATALIFPSKWYEGFPMSIAESLALGTPVLTTNIGNQADVVKQSQGGVTFEPEDEQSFVKAMAQMVENRETLSRNARRYYDKVLNRETNYQILNTIYSSCTSAKRARSNRR